MLMACKRINLMNKLFNLLGLKVFNTPWEYFQQKSNDADKKKIYVA